MKHRKPTPSLELLRELFSYHPDGYLVWRASGKRAGGNHGLYTGVQVKGSKFYAHRLIWAWHYGVLGVDVDIDHINGSKRDNRIENLQELSHRDNSTKGFSSDLPTGVSRNGSGFRAEVYIDGKRHYLGQFRSAAEASEAYQNAIRAKVAGKPLSFVWRKGTPAPEWL